MYNDTAKSLARIIREGSASGAFGDRGSLKTMMGA
jgi:hypothetical protein